MAEPVREVPSTPLTPPTASRVDAPPPTVAETNTSVFDEREEVVVDDQQSVYRREQSEYGGIRFGIAFFGWLTATGLTVTLSAIAAGVIAAFGFETDAVEADFGAALASAIVLLAILFISYVAGGYVAGRMARFGGAKQGVAVWIWGVAVTGVLIAVAAIAGTRFDVLSEARIVPEIAFGPDQALGTALTIAGALAVTLLGAILGGLAGMRFHRRVDRAGWAH